MSQVVESALALLLLAGLSTNVPNASAAPAQNGVVRGSMQLVTLRSSPLTGTVRFASDKRTVLARTSDHGYFLVHLPPGDYRVTGRSPQFQDDTSVCPGGTIQVSAGSTKSLLVNCQGF